MMKQLLLIASMVLLASEILAAPRLDPSEINRARYETGRLGKEMSPLVIKLQILLDRSAISPGVIDGRMGENLKGAIREFESRSDLPVDGKIDSELWRLLSDGAPDVLVSYAIAAGDIEGPFAETIPEDFAEMARMDRLSYTSPAELIAEKFHMHIALLKALNPGASFDRQGERIMVANVLDSPPGAKLARIDVDKSDGVVRGYAEDGSLVVAYPASIGSDENPSPSGSMTVKTTAEDPEYFYRPTKNFQQGDNTEPLDLPPGPNGPVGSIWIDLSKEGYGIHGTPDPERVGKSASHGCVRLTNWDAEELAGLVRVGIPVTIAE